ncbi:hypothetical protein ACUJ46_08570 [Sandaracinobacteroides sp. A072]|uniref:hypothetical protein n=1 Tax=Sandaracinobacteroides sp. A072 TaxID=3461146 RepID=UPI00404343B1
MKFLPPTLVQPTLGLLLLAGCATTPPVAETPPPPMPAGLGQVMGKPAETAIALMGAPALDRKEGPARHLQFSGGCILDLFYYPGKGGGAAPLATHAEARLPGGRAFAPGACLEMLIRARPNK